MKEANQNRPKLSVCFPVYDDFDGLYFSAMNLVTTHAASLRDLEIIIVDNHPDSASGKTTKTWVESHLNNNVRARYVAFPGDGGPALSKQKCVDEAAGEFVLVMDSHVFVAAGGIAHLLAHYAKNPETVDLFSGPMVYDSFAHLFGAGADLGTGGYATHMDEVWRGENLGIWATDQRARMLDAEPFEVPAMGCGLFTCRKESFAGFNPNFRGFGAEEYYIHHKTRQRGGKVFCLPFLRWIHRFGRPLGVPYPLTRWNKIRNYVIGHQELGLPLDGIHGHFVTPGLLSQAEWDRLISDPIGQTSPSQKAKSGCSSCSIQPNDTLEDIYGKAWRNASDINEHAPKLRELATGLDTVVEFGHRRGVSTTALLAGQPKKLVSFDLNEDPVWKEIKKRQGGTDYSFVRGDVTKADIPECDLLFEDSRHTAGHIVAILERHAAKVRGRIAFHDTVVFGERGEDGGPGILVGLRAWLRKNQDWTVVYHSQANNGFTVISRRPEDKKRLPSIAKMGWNFAKAVAKHAAAGMPAVPEAVFESRMDVCATCQHRSDNRCSVCGCFIDQKGLWLDSECPLGLWPVVEPAAQPEPAGAVQADKAA